METKSKKEYDKKEFKPCDIKLILLGDSAAGKSNEERQMSTFALTMYRHKEKIDGKEYEIDIWDTAGQDCFQKLHPSYYFEANVCVLVFDISRKITYKNLQKWYEEMRSQCPHIPTIFFENNSVDRSVTERSFKFASDNSLQLYYVSAADGTNVVKVFEDALKLGLENKLNPPDTFMKDVMEFLNEESII